MASYFKAKSWPYKNNTFEAILSDKDCNSIIKWLRSQRLVYKDSDLGYILVHAGVYPKWDLDETFYLASLVEKSLQGNNCKEFIETLWTNRPNKWNSNFSNEEKVSFFYKCIYKNEVPEKDLSLDFENKVKSRREFIRYSLFLGMNLITKCLINIK